MWDENPVLESRCVLADIELARQLDVAGVPGAHLSHTTGRLTESPEEITSSLPKDRPGSQGLGSF